jgi:hypothetical protein
VPDLTDVLDLPAIPQHHRTRHRRILDTLAAGAGHTPNAHQLPPAPAHALAQHALLGAEAAARRGDETTFLWYTDHTDCHVEPLLGPHGTFPVALTPEPGDLITSRISETPYYLLNPRTRAAEPALQALLRDSATTAANLGFAHLINHHATVVCLLNRKPLGSPLRSWTISRLPGTVFCDYVADPTILGRDLVHEAGHTWLNDALSATGTALDNTRTFYSPWKNTHRPTYGFLHACWSFALVALYVAAALDQPGIDNPDYLTNYLHRRRAELRTVGDNHEEALTLVPDTDLRERLREVYQQAAAL